MSSDFASSAESDGTDGLSVSATGRRRRSESDVKLALGLVEVSRMSTEPLDDCKRCGRQVREDHSYVMVVPVGHKRMYFHGGCEPIGIKPDPAEDKITSAHEG